MSTNKFDKLLDNVERILAVEAIVSCQGIDRQRPYKSTPTVERLYEKIRKVVSPLEENANLDTHLEKVISLLKNNELIIE